MARMTFAEFWPFYVSQHRDRGCRRWHFAGTALAGGCVALGLLLSPRWLLLAPVLGYGCSWIGHFTCEHNLPAAWHSPWLSLLGDLRMFWLTLRGEMDAEVERVTPAP